MYPAGRKGAVEIRERDLNGLVAAVNRFCGTKRTVTGKLSKSAGLLTEMEPIVKQFSQNPTTIPKDAMAMFNQEKSSNPSPSIILYAQYMEKIQKEGKGYIQKELTRLTTLINAPSVDGKKADEFAIRRNILQVFAEASGVEVPADLANEDLVAPEAILEPVADEEDHPSEETL